MRWSCAAGCSLQAASRWDWSSGSTRGADRDGLLAGGSCEHRSSRPAESDPRASLEPARAAIAASDHARWRQECCGLLQHRRCSSTDPLRQARGLAGWSLQERSRRSMGVERMLLSCARQLSARISGGSACVACSDTCTCTCDSTCVVSWKCLHSSRDGSCCQLRDSSVWAQVVVR